jgi:formamidopyrimidine-DNA glycosylase
MPELVEVENFRQLLLSLKNEACSSSSSQLKVETPSPPGPKVFPSPSELKLLENCSVQDVERKGKLLRLVLSPKEEPNSLPYLYLHMGMTGRISTPENIPSLESLASTDTFPPPHTHLILSLDEKQVAYSDPRRFGAISFGEPLSSQWDSFAVDALDPNACLAKLVNCKKGVKALLLDQRAVVSGVGNWIADEILYQSKIHPDQSYLTLDEVDALGKCLDFVLRRGIACLSANKSFPADWLFHRRWSKRSGDKLLDGNGKNITFLKSGGRTSAIVPSIQRKKARKSLVIDEKPNENVGCTKQGKRRRKSAVDDKKSPVTVNSEDLKNVLDIPSHHPERKSKRIAITRRRSQRLMFK